MTISNRLIVALDLPDAAATLEVAEAVAPHVGMVKVGLEGFVAHGPRLLRQLTERGLGIFLDLKLHDIPRTAEAAAREASRFGAELLTVHAAGGRDMIAAAREGADPATKIVAVTMLTSLDEEAAQSIGFGGSVSESALRLGQLAMDAGADGLVCSAHELDRLSSVGGVRVVPGVRPAGSDAGDQKRVATPADAVRAGATWIVVGRPIVQADNPGAAAQKIHEEIKAS